MPLEELCVERSTVFTQQWAIMTYPCIQSLFPLFSFAHTLYTTETTSLAVPSTVFQSGERKKALAITMRFESPKTAPIEGWIKCCWKESNISKFLQKFWDAQFFFPISLLTMTILGKNKPFHMAALTASFFVATTDSWTACSNFLAQAKTKAGGRGTNQ